MKFYKRDPDRALAGMAELSLRERGAYNTILDTLYSRDGLLRDDDEILRRIMGCHGNEWRAVKAKLIAARKIWVEDGYIKARGVDSTLEEAEIISEKQRKNAAKRREIERKTPRKQPEISEKFNENNAPGKPYKEIESIEEPNGSSPPISPKAKGATSLDEQWQPNERAFDVGRKEGYSVAEVEWLADDFRDYWRGNGKRKKDWHATFYNSLRSDIAHRKVDQRRRSVGGSPNISRGRGSGGKVAALRDLAARSRDGAGFRDSPVRGDGDSAGAGGGAGSGFPETGEPRDCRTGVDGNGPADEGAGGRRGHGTPADGALSRQVIPVSVRCGGARLSGVDGQPSLLAGMGGFEDEVGIEGARPPVDVAGIGRGGGGS